MQNSNENIDSEEENNNISLEELLLQSDLLAGIARADGKVLDIESMVASAYFENENSGKSDLVKSHFEYVAQDEATDMRLSTVMSFMSKLSKDEKLKLLRCISAVAICDGDLHPKELSIIKQFAKTMNIDIRDT